MSARSSAERTRECRRRQKEGIAVLSVEVNLFELSDAMVEAGLIKQWDSEDRAVVEDALSVVVDSWIERRGEEN